MNRIIWIAIVTTIFGLAGCANNGGTGQPLRVQDDGGMNASQASARNIAPITSYINTRY